MIKRETMYELAEHIAKQFGVRIVLRKFDEYPGEGDVIGLCSYWEDLIEVNVEACRRRTRGNYISTLLHECAHVWAYRNGIFLAYHTVKPFEDMTIPELENYIRVAWRAERWVEKKAQSWMQEMFPGETYWYSYGRVKLNKKWFDRAELREVRAILRKKKLRAIDRAQRNAA